MSKTNSILIILLIFSSGCYFNTGLKAGDKAVAKFHDKYNDKEFEKIYEESSVEFKGVYDKKKVMNHLEQIHEALGKIEYTSRKGWTVRNDSIRLVTIINTLTKYEKGEAKEKFVFSIDEEIVELMEYEFASEDVTLQ